jgi:hypothetical protein
MIPLAWPQRRGRIDIRGTKKPAAVQPVVVLDGGG